MAKEVTGTLKLQIPAGQANPSPPVGPALGQAGLNIMEFCKDFNAKTQAQAGDVLPVVITIYNDKSFSFVCKQPPASALLKKAAKIASDQENHKTKVATITKDQLLEIVKIKNLTSTPKTMRRRQELLLEVPVKWVSKLRGCSKNI